MKSFVFYLILIVLFLAGTKLVYRQQQYTRSIQALAQAEPTIITDGPATDDATQYPSPTGSQQPNKSTEAQYGRSRTLMASSVSGVVRYHKRTTEGELTNVEKKDNTPTETYPFAGHYIHVPH